MTAGTYTVTSVSDIHCAGTGTGSAQVTLLPLPNVVLLPFADACEGGTPFMLTGGGPAGGTYSGNGVSGGMFDPTAAGVGIHPIIYTYTDANNCSNTATQNITVWPSPNVSLSALPDVCPGDAPFLLAGGNPVGGSFSGPGISNNIFDPSIAGPGTHTITYSYTDPNNCTNTATNTINVLQAPVVTFPSPGSVCASAAPFNLTGGSPAGGSYYGPGVVNGIFSPAMAGPGNHIVVYSYIDPVTGCSDTAQAHISVFSLPVVTLTPFNAYCVSSPPFALSGGNPAGGFYSGTGVSSNMFNPSVAGLGTHTINYTYVDPLTSCTNTASTSLVVNSGIQISVTPDNVTICSGSYASLTALGAQSYSWSPASSLSASTGAAVIANPTATTQYTVVGTNADGCTGSAVTTVDIHPMADLNFTPEPADGCAPLTVDFEFNATMSVVQNNSWLWNFNDPGYPGNTSTLQEPTHTFQNAGIYNVLLTIATIHGCQESFVTPVTVHPKPIAAFSTQPDVAYINHPEFQFIDESVYGSYWYWDFGDPASMLQNYSDIQNPLHMYSDTGTFEVMLVVESQHHCSDTVINEVYIFPESLFYIPNAFTPDEDGLNDYFKPEFTAIMENMYEFYIYDRWGRLVFETKDINDSWDGRLKSGEFGRGGVYTWVIIFYERNMNKHKIAGIVTMIR
jgi:gliding motility-associated-like protein